MARLKCAVVISGRGSNLQALIDACAAPSFPAEIVSVISDKPDAAGLKRAEAAKIPHRIIDPKERGGRAGFESTLDESLKQSGAELVCLAGFMRVLSEGFVEKWRDKLINIHPSLLPAFPGLHTHERAIKAGVRFTGCTVHFVRSDIDNGPIILQAAVPVLPDDIPAKLADRVLAAEHRIYPEAVRLIAFGRVTIRDDIVRIDGAQFAAAGLFNPIPGD